MIWLGLDETHTVLTMTQMMHIAAFACGLLPGITCGGTVVLLPAFDAAQTLDLIERWRCTYMLTLPAMLRFVVEEQGRNPRDVSSMRLCLAGGDTVPVDSPGTLSHVFGIPVREIFGMTETVPITCIREGAPRIGSVGPALDLVDARVADPASKEVADGQDGRTSGTEPGQLRRLLG